MSGLEFKLVKEVKGAFKEAPEEMAFTYEGPAGERVEFCGDPKVAWSWLLRSNMPGKKPGKALDAITSAAIHNGGKFPPVLNIKLGRAS